MRYFKIYNKTFFSLLLVLFLVIAISSSKYSLALACEEGKDHSSKTFTEILLKFKTGHLETEAEQEDFYKRFGIVVTGAIPTLGIFKVKPVDADIDIDKLLNDIEKDPDILYAEPNNKVSTQMPE